MKLAILLLAISGAFALDAFSVKESDMLDGPPVDLVPADPDVGKDMTQIITARGYNVETHYVTTVDGYILTMFRIPFGKSKSGPIGAPVLLQHGLLDSSYTWVNNFDDQSLGYILADAGYDMWFGNNRGNKYGRNHTTFNPDDKSSHFWDFTWDEMARYDVPSMINYVLDASDYDSLSWVGHSEGTIQMFAAGSSVEVHAQDAFFQRALKSVNLFLALAPVAYVSNQKSKVLKLLASTDLPENLYNRGFYEFLPDGRVDTFAPEICRLIERGCDVFIMTLCGPTLNINASRIQVYVSQTPAGTSTLNMWHWAQGVVSDTFQYFDWGSAEANQLHYGQEAPPSYDLAKMAVPTALFYGKHDYLADEDDVKKLLTELPANMVVFTSELDNYAHLDYTWAVNANVNVYDKVLQQLAKYTKGK